MSEFSSSTKVKESSSISSSKKVSSSSSKVSSSSISSSSEIDSLLSKSSAARDTARSLASKLSTDLEDEMEGLLLSNTTKPISSLSSMGSSLDGDGVKSSSSIKSHSSSSATKAALSTRTAMVDGVVVSAETAADKSVRKAEAGREKHVEDGVVTSDAGFKKEATSDAKLRATKEMSGAELDAFFRTPAITGQPPEALEFDKGSNSFQMKLADLPQFSPKELTVNIVDNVITVLGSHEEIAADGTNRSHTYLRRFTVPKGLKRDEVGWELEPSGVLAIKAGEGVVGGCSQVHLDCTIFKPRSFFKKKD